MTIGDTLRHLTRTAGDDPRTDAELLTRFVHGRDEAAFAELFRRHGPTVYGVCRRVLGNAPDADDAFQAVFLVLARKADTVRPPGMVGNWLYGVAVRTANKVRVMNARKVNRRRQPPGGLDQHPAADTVGSPDHDTLAVIDAELATLPDVYRAAFVACDLNGRSRSEASRELGWPEGTVAARLVKARELLATRLRKRGVTLGAATLAAVSVPPALATETLGAVRELLTAGVASAASPVAQTLSDEVVKAMAAFKLKLAVGVVLFALTAGTVGLLASSGEKPGPRPERKPMTNAPVPKAPVAEWKEEAPLELKGGGRVTGVAFAPSGKTVAVCRADGKIDFFDPATRKHQQSMAVGGEKGTDVAAITAVAFRPTPHPKNGDVFAVTHKGGVRIGTVGLGLFTDDAAAIEGIPPNWVLPDFDPHQVTWLRNDAGGEKLAVTNGKEARVRLTAVAKDAPAMIAHNWAGYEHRPSVLAAVPGEDKALFTVNTQMRRAADDPFDVWVRSLVHSALSVKLSGHKSRPVAAAMSSDGKRVVSADEGGTVIVWEGETFEEKRRIELGDGVMQLTLAPDGKTVAVVRAFVDTTLLGRSGRTLFNLELFVLDVTGPPKEPKPLWSTRNVLSDAKAFTGPASLAFSPDGKTLLAAFADPYIADKDAKPMGVKVWTLGEPKKNAPVPKPAEWKEAKALELDGKRVTSVAVSPDGKTLAVGQDAGVSVIDVEKRTVIGPSPFGEPPAHRAVAFSPTGDLLAVTTKDGVVFAHPRLKPVEMGRWVEKGSDPHQVAVLPDNRRVVATNGEKVFANFGPPSAVPADERANPFGAVGWPANRHKPSVLAVLGERHILCTFDNGGRDDDRAVFRLPTDKVRDGDDVTKLSGHKSRPVAAAVSADGKRIVTGDEGGTLIVWEGEKFEFQEKRRIEQGPGLTALALAPDGKTMAVLRSHGVSWLGALPNRSSTVFQLYVFDVTAPPAKPTPIWENETRSLPGKQSGPASLVFSPDGKTLYAAFADPFTADAKLYGEIPKSVGVKVWERVPRK